MLDRTQKRVGHGREREVGNDRMKNKKRKNGESIYLNSKQPRSFLLIRMFAY